MSDEKKNNIVQFARIKRGERVDNKGAVILREIDEASDSNALLSCLAKALRWQEKKLILSGQYGAARQAAMKRMEVLACDFIRSTLLPDTLNPSVSRDWWYLKQKELERLWNHVGLFAKYLSEVEMIQLTSEVKRAIGDRVRVLSTLHAKKEE